MKDNRFDVDAFIQSLEGKVVIAGYGSLLSSSSRERHSQLFTPTIPVFVDGWQRGWLTRAYHESQTYVGALPNRQSSLNAQLIPMQINPAFETREQDYRFTKIALEQIRLPRNFSQDKELSNALQRTPIYICETLDVKEADDEHPVNFSYVATCLAGSHESCQHEGIDDFLNHTSHWRKAHINMDIERAEYPRSADLSESALQHFAARLRRHLKE
jgi:hypothetical protein